MFTYFFSLAIIAFEVICCKIFFESFCDSSGENRKYKRTILLVLLIAIYYIWVLSHVFPPFCFPLPLSPKRLPAPFLRRVPALARSPQLLDTCPEVTSGQSVQKSVSLRCFPGRGISFRTVIRFSRCCPSMNYPKSTPK